MEEKLTREGWHLSHLMMKRNFFRGWGFIGSKDSWGQLTTDSGTTYIREVLEPKLFNKFIEFVRGIDMEPTEEDGTMLFMCICV